MSIPHASISAALRSTVVRSRGSLPGREDLAGVAVERDRDGADAPRSRARSTTVSNTARWPRWTPSKKPTVTTRGPSSSGSGAEPVDQLHAAEATRGPAARSLRLASGRGRHHAGQRAGAGGPRASRRRSRMRRAGLAGRWLSSRSCVARVRARGRVLERRSRPLDDEILECGRLAARLPAPERLAKAIAWLATPFGAILGLRLVDRPRARGLQAVAAPRARPWGVRLDSCRWTCRLSALPSDPLPVTPLVGTPGTSEPSLLPRRTRSPASRSSLGGDGVGAGAGGPHAPGAAGRRRGRPPWSSRGA